MDEITSVAAAIQAQQAVAQNDLRMRLIKQSAQADQALADMLAKNADAVRAQEQGAQGGISIYA